ncbi:PQQ-dependent sugar dehydrogenase [Variovorax sp. PAMC 28711]|uniref:PQQ-dependent sugar dehydrogenase n=1 Tax=Variovorax sp. PAMC 28711 TaxID=1795631 RepID=UPI00078D92A4|nr:PQQ-dependent sugar dehydrogenase [Variovorax sp. PAMC 28711]AMM24181.1 glucose dehydrogenase [Variovorax sp. PAMC 28711]
MQAHSPRRRSLIFAGLACALCALALPASAQADASVAYRIDTIAQGLAHPWSLATLPDGSLLVTERAGRLRVIERDAGGRMQLRTTPVTGVPPVYASGQSGLFDVLIDPGFADNRLVYLSFAHGDSAANHLRVVRARFERGALQDVRVIFSSRPAKTHDQHFGARMALLDDGTLVIGIGDGNLERIDAQKLNTHLGKTVRIGRDGSVPADNPFVGRAGALPEIYSLGHRNPQGMVSLPGQRVLYAHEHGSKGGDELNRVVPGANYGWPITTGGVDYTGARITPWRTYPGITPPLVEWTPSIAPAGMAHYDGALFPAWRGSLFVAALKEKSVRRVPMKEGVPGSQEILFTELNERMRDVRSGPDGALYLLTDAPNGRVLRVRPR